MLTHLVILLDDTSVSYCHYENTNKEARLISLDVLKRAVIWAMKENLNIQFVYPNYPLPESYRQVVESIDHTKIGPIGCGEDLDIIVLDNDLQIDPQTPKCYLWRCDLSLLNENKEAVKMILPKVLRLNIVLTDIGGWKQREFDSYRALLADLAQSVLNMNGNDSAMQLNLLTDRILLGEMNNCNAGDTNVALAPDGRFYVCPAFYPTENCGSLQDGLNIKNKNLYKLSHAPICRLCDAYQCRRCVWMNSQLTLDINTPSHEQCVASHLERNTSQWLQQKLSEKGVVIRNSKKIEDVDYLDPINKVDKWKREKLWER